MLQAPSLAPALVLGLGMAGCVTGAPAPAPDHKTAIYASCAVTARPAAGGLIVEGRFTADVATRGRFELNILDSGAGGIATIRQGGPFQAAAGETVLLGRTVFGGAPVVGATMVVTLDSGRIMGCAPLDP